MSVFRLPKTSDRQRTKSQTWSIRYRDNQGKCHQVNGFETREEAAAHLGEIKGRLAEQDRLKKEADKE